VSPVLGLRGNVRQFALQVAVSALVGGMVGQERTAFPSLRPMSLASPGFGMPTTIVAIAAITAGSGLVVFLRMRERLVRE
jgi:hypothetical protein